MSPTFEELKKDPFERKIIQLIEQQYGSPLPEHIQRFLLESREWSQVKAEQNRQWVSTTKYLTEKICDGTATVFDFNLFWIRLWAIVCEFYKEERKQLQLYGRSSTFGPILYTINDLADKFSEDEVMFIEYMRHCNSHIHQDYIVSKPKLSKEGNIIDYNKSPKAQQVIPIIDRILATHNLDESKIAKEYAGRVVHDLKKLEKLVNEASKTV